MLAVTTDLPLCTNTSRLWDRHQSNYPLLQFKMYTSIGSKFSLEQKTFLAVLTLIKFKLFSNTFGQGQGQGEMRAGEEVGRGRWGQGRRGQGKEDRRIRPRNSGWGESRGSLGQGKMRSGGEEGSDICCTMKANFHDCSILTMFNHFIKLAEHWIETIGNMSYCFYHQ